MQVAATARLDWPRAKTVNNPEGTGKAENINVMEPAISLKMPEDASAPSRFLGHDAFNVLVGQDGIPRVPRAGRSGIRRVNLKVCGHRKVDLL